MPIVGKSDVIFTASDKQFQSVGKRVMQTMARVQARAARVGQAARNMLLIAGGAIAGFLVLAGRQQKAEAKLAAVIKATGGAAGFTAKQLIKEAAALQKITTFGDEVIINAQAIIATFKSIKGDQFKATTEVVLDMAAALDQDLKSAAIQVGKAMNDPILGATALSRAGVQFTQKQRDMIRTLVESNRLFGAQAIILKELQSQFGGVAQAIAETDTGKLQQMKNILGDIGETIGEIFTPALADAADELKENAEAITEWIERNQAMIKVTTSVGAKLAVLLILLPKITAALKFLFAALVSVRLAAGGLAVAALALIPATLFAALVNVNQELDRIARNLREAAAAGATLRDIFDQIAKSKAAGDLAGVLSGKQAAVKERQLQAERLRTRIQDLEKLQQASARRREDEGRRTGGRVLPPGQRERLRVLEIKDLEGELSILRTTITRSQAAIRELEAKIAELQQAPALPGTAVPGAAAGAARRGLPTGQFFGAQALFKAIQQRVSGADKEAQARKAALDTAKATQGTAVNTKKTALLLESVNDALRGGIGAVFT